MPAKPWNKGKLVGPKKHLTPDHVIDIERGLKRTGALRDLALFRVGICSMLRASDLVKLKTVDIAPDGTCAKRIRVRMQKTGEPVEAVLADKTRKAAALYQATGNMRKVQILLGHKDITTTVRDLGVTS